jgi:hypothetical protein
MRDGRRKWEGGGKEQATRAEEGGQEDMKSQREFFMVGNESVRAATMSAIFLSFTCSTPTMYKV